MNLEEAIKNLSNEDKLKIKDINNPNEIVKYLMNKGIDINEYKNNELTDDELENVVGGIDLTEIIKLLIKKLFD